MFAHRRGQAVNGNQSHTVAVVSRLIRMLNTRARRCLQSAYRQVAVVSQPFTASRRAKHGAHIRSRANLSKGPDDGKDVSLPRARERI